MQKSKCALWRAPPLWSALLCVAGACAVAAPRPAVMQRAVVLSAGSGPPSPASVSSGSGPPSPPSAQQERLTLQARAQDVLERHCGECHAAHRASAVPAALAIFDLDQPAWPERFDARRFEVAVARLADKPASDQAAFRAFRDASLVAH